MTPNLVAENAFWRKVRSASGLFVGRALRPAVILFLLASDRRTPFWARSLIALALLYFVSPIDLIPDPLPFGYVDDVVVLLATLASLGGLVREEHVERADEMLGAKRRGGRGRSR